MRLMHNHFREMVLETNRPRINKRLGQIIGTELAGQFSCETILSKTQAGGRMSNLDFLGGNFMWVGRCDCQDWDKGS